MLTRVFPNATRLLAISALLATLAFVGTAAVAADESDAVHNVRTTQLDATSAVVEWDPPTGQTTDWYRVELKRGWSTTYRFVYEPRASFTGLFPGQTYEFRAEVAFQPATWSAPIEFTTTEVPAPATPDDVNATVTPGSVTVDWAPVDGAVDYVIRWTEHHSGTVVSDTSITRQLPPGDDLEITVTARNEFRTESAPSDPLVVTVPPAQSWQPLTAPTNLELVVEDGIVERIEWDPPEGGMEPITYRLNYHFGDQGPDQAAMIATSSEPSIDVRRQIGRLSQCGPDSSPGQTWVIWVSAHSHGTSSPPSEQTTVCLS